MWRSLKVKVELMFKNFVNMALGKNARETEVVEISVKRSVSTLNCSFCFHNCAFYNCFVTFSNVLLLRFIFGRLFKNILMVCTQAVHFSIAKMQLHLLSDVVFLYLESLGDCSFLNTCFHMDTCKVSFKSKN